MGALWETKNVSRVHVWTAWGLGSKQGFRVEVKLPGPLRGGTSQRSLGVAEFTWLGRSPRTRQNSPYSAAAEAGADFKLRALGPERGELRAFLPSLATRLHHHGRHTRQHRQGHRGTGAHEISLLFGHCSG